MAFQRTKTLSDNLCNPSSPSFLFGSTPPRDGTDEAKATESCAKFTHRSAVLATDGFIVYDIQDEKGRTTMERPFPFRKTLDPSWYGTLIPKQSGKQCVIYKCIVEHSNEAFSEWVANAVNVHKHNSFVLVGAPSSATKSVTTMKSAAAILNSYKAQGVSFGCVAIAERHTKKNNEQFNMMRKQNYGAEFFITQGVFNSSSIIRLLNDYGALCRELDVAPKKVILTFAPCGRAKTMTFIKWLGMHVPEAVEARIMGAKRDDLQEGERDVGPVNESIALLLEVFKEVLEGTAECGVPIGINVESLSIFREEIDAAHTLFGGLQEMLLNSHKTKTNRSWAVKWYEVGEGYSAYDQIVIQEKEEKKTKQYWYAVCILGGIFGYALGLQRNRLR
jgi:5,10-methylenetetrahydrofolate reductase